MALSPQQVWEVRTTGSDSNGGGFKAGATGTDYSQQDAAQVAYSDLAIDASTNTKVASAAGPFTSAHVGNVLNVTGGAGFTAGRYEVTSVAAGVATLDRAVGAVSSTGGTGKLGGALLTIGMLASAMVASNKAFVKSGTYTLAAGVTFAQSVATPSQSAPPTAVVGYYQARGDLYAGSASNANRPLIQAGAAINVLLTPSGTGMIFRNLAFGSGSNSFNYALFSGSQHQYVNLKVSGFSAVGIYNSGSGLALACEVAGGLSGATAAIQSNSYGRVLACHVHDNACTGIVANFAQVDRCLVVNNAGSTSDGMALGTLACATGNTVHRNGRHGINLTAQNFAMTAILNNLITENGGYGIACTAGAGTPASECWDGNCFHANASGQRNNLDDAATNPVDGVGAYTNVRDVALTATPYIVNSSPFDLRLNATSGGGLAARGAGVPQSWPGASYAAYPDFGAAQHQDSGTITNTYFLEG